jgi:hypothetical protein
VHVNAAAKIETYCRRNRLEPRPLFQCSTESSTVLRKTSLYLDPGPGTRQSIADVIGWSLVTVRTPTRFHALVLCKGSHRRQPI